MVTAPDKIADWVVILNEWRLANCQSAHDIDPRGFTAPRRKAVAMSHAYAARQEIQEMLRAQLIVAVLAGGLLPSRTLLTNTLR
jgi:hypothetical protein